MRFSRDIFALLLYTLLASSPQALAHHSPSEIIESLTRRIAKGEHTAIVYVRRGEEFRAMGDPKSAAADFQFALQRQPKNIPALHGRAQALFSLSHWDEAQTAAKQGLVSTSNADEAAPFYAILARIHEQKNHWSLALDSWRHAIASSRPNVDWFLGESRSLKKLNRIDDARQALEAARKRNPSTVLRRAWIELLIHGDEKDEAEKQILAGLARARWKSSWLLLRARLHLAQNQPEAAKQDARTALLELNQRQSSRSVNPFLVADRGLAHQILGHEEKAKADMELARSYGVSHEKLAE